jgi:hypothetical protein
MSLTHHFRKFSFASSVVALASPLLGMTLFSSVAQAQNLVKNGGFENNSGAGQLLWAPVTDWTLVITGISTPNLGVRSLAPGGVPLWGLTPWVNNNGFRASNNGGYFIVNDSDPQYGGGFSQVIDDLTPGNQYELNFEYAWVQEAPAGGNTWQYVYGTFGPESFQTPTGYLPSHGFDGGPVPADGDGWYTYTKTFTASSTSQTLKFLANGGPAGLPPMALMDGISLTDTTPVPGPVPLMGVGATLAWSRGLRRRIKRSVLN